MSKKIKCALLTFTLASVVALSAATSACTVKTNHPRAKITVSFNEVDYEIEYTLYRNLYPQTVQHFIELADEGFYEGMIVHDYRPNDWATGAYALNADESVNYSSSYSGNSMVEYLEKNSKEDAYYELFANGALSPSVYRKISYDLNGKETVDPSDALPSLIGEFSSNNHNIENGALSSAYGSLKMFYYDKGSSKQKVAVENSFGEIMELDYKNNCATSIFTMQVGNTSAYNSSNYCVFGRLRNDGDRGRLEDLTDAISDYIADELGGSTSRFSTTVTTKTDVNDTFAEEGGREIETSFTVTSMPIFIKSVKITKY